MSFVRIFRKKTVHFSSDCVLRCAATICAREFEIRKTGTAELGEVGARSGEWSGACTGPAQVHTGSHGNVGLAQYRDAAGAR